MKPTNLSLRRQSKPVCQLCDYILRQPVQRRRFLTSSTLYKTSTPRQPQPPHGLYPRLVARKSTSANPETFNSTISGHSSTQHASEVSIELEKASNLVQAILKSTAIPTEETTLSALRACESAAHLLTDLNQRPNNASSSLSTNPTSAVLGLHPPPDTTTAQTDYLSSLAYSLLKHPPVYITPSILSAYITTQSILHRPATFPEAFSLYARKPIPKPSTSPIQYRTQSTTAVTAAIPSPIAAAALSAAIAARSLPLALSVIETSYRAPAFRRAKLLRKALPPLVGATLAPVAAYTLASQLSMYQNTMDGSTATMIAFAGILTYVSATATIGVVAVTTANDQMERVTWATGMPLRERWLREEERAAIDRVAGAWGFKELWKRGEEEGEDWEFLREWIGVRGMVLDKTELLEGME
ncbi:hypothetical protein K432DRAFT_297195 [Lepidopterella palustris CBS 459.81]|uniref:Uncharacterized protein n=1 Tax=Lepidopterella palustris CBS 459.81 TaxID=1314670 RepID=A0A8E2EAX9_9PEZI|nr:hypothetical protein K432DRAFT_297195 [Lepidopterella palustris CBS 459.81]